MGAWKAYEWTPTKRGTADDLPWKQCDSHRSQALLEFGYLTWNVRSCKCKLLSDPVSSEYHTSKACCCIPSLHTVTVHLPTVQNNPTFSGGNVLLCAANQFTNKIPLQVLDGQILHLPIRGMYHVERLFCIATLLNTGTEAIQEEYLTARTLMATTC